METKPWGYWDYENCFNEAKKYKKRSEFNRLSNGAYEKARQNGWLKDYSWLLSYHDALSEARTYWTADRCFEAAKKYKSKSEFRSKCVGAYTAALKNGWLNSYTWLKRQNRTGGVYCVYVYEDTTNKYAYVGLTCNYGRRDNEHRKGQLKRGVRKFDCLYKYFNGNIPDGHIKVNMLTAEEAQYYEFFYATKYIDDGWSLINKAKTGSLGTGVVKWDYNTCFKEAKKYNSRGEFAKKSKGAYECARMNGWLDDYDWFNKSWAEKRSKKAGK